MQILTYQAMFGCAVKKIDFW